MHTRVCRSRAQLLAFAPAATKIRANVPRSTNCPVVRNGEETWLPCVLSHSILPSAMVTIRVEHRETIYPLSGRRFLTCNNVARLNTAMLDRCVVARLARSAHASTTERDNTDALWTAVSRSDHRSGRRRSTDGDGEAPRQQCWCGAATTPDCPGEHQRAGRRRGSPDGCKGEQHQNGNLYANEDLDAPRAPSCAK